jgi:drug/metabolite transporter (DMT)-like permease
MPLLILIFGVFACSTSVIFIKLSGTDPILLTGFRLVVAVLLLLPFFLRARKRFDFCIDGGFIRKMLSPGFFLALHLIAWNIGARMTPAANASLIVNMVPVAMPFVLYYVIREKLSKAEWTGTGFAMVGVVGLGIADFHLSVQYALGDVICFGSMVLYTLYLVAARKNRDIPSVYLYVVPVYLTAAVFAFIFALLAKPFGLVGDWFGPNVGLDLLCIIGLGAIPTVLGHSIINWALRQTRGQVVAIVNLHQFVFAGILAWLIFTEIPSLYFILTALCILTGAVIVIRYR